MSDFRSIFMGSRYCSLGRLRGDTMPTAKALHSVSTAI